MEWRDTWFRRYSFYLSIYLSVDIKKINAYVLSLTHLSLFSLHSNHSAKFTSKGTYPRCNDIRSDIIAYDIIPSSLLYYISIYIAHQFKEAFGAIKAAAEMQRSQKELEQADQSRKAELEEKFFSGTTSPLFLPQSIHSHPLVLID